MARIWSGSAGDCDASGVLDVTDVDSVALEVFDRDGEYWADAPDAGFPGSPAGCDANADTRIRAADLLCTHLLSSGGSCGGLRPGPWPHLLVSTVLEPDPPGVMVWIQGTVDRMEGIGSLAFSLDLDPGILDFAAIDGDDDGVPDHLRFPLGAPDFAWVRWDDEQAEIDVLLADLSGAALPEGLVIEIGLPLAAWPEAGLEISQAPSPSFGTTGGTEKEGVWLLDLGIFSDGFESGNLDRWSGSVP